MNKNNSIKNDFKSAFKELRVVTKKDLERFVTRVDLKAMEDRQDKKYTSKTDLHNGLSKLERSLKRRMGQESNKIVVSIGKLALSAPTKKEFDELKNRVDRLHPAN